MNRTLDQREDKSWAYADLLLQRTLQLTSDVVRSRDDLERQVGIDGDKYPFESLLLVVRELCRHPSAASSRLVDLGEWLRARLAPSKRGAPLQATTTTEASCTPS